MVLYKSSPNGSPCEMPQHFSICLWNEPKASDDQLYVLHYIAACRWLSEENVATHIPWHTVSALKYDPEHHDPSAYTYSRNFQYCAAKKKEGIVVLSHRGTYRTESAFDPSAQTFLSSTWSNS